MSMLRQAMLKESRTAIGRLSLEDLQRLELKSSARLLVFKEAAKSSGLGDDFLKRAEFYLEKVARRMRVCHGQVVVQRKQALLAKVT